MRHTRICGLGLAVLAVVTALPACTGTTTGSTSSSTTSTVPRTPYPPPSSIVVPRASYPSHQVPSTSCPAAHPIGLAITTDSAAEVDRLADVIACTDAAGATTYLKNTGDAVWTLRSRATRAGLVNAVDDTLQATSFRAIVRAVRPDGPAMMTPGSAVTVDLPPALVQWDLDLLLSVDWMGHEVMAGKIKTIGMNWYLGALSRRSPARAALVRCTLGVDEAARSVPGLADADFTQVLLVGLGTASTVNQCRQAAVRIQTVDDNGSLVTASDELGRLKTQAAFLDDVSGRLTAIARTTKLMNFIKFIRV